MQRKIINLSMVRYIRIRERFLTGWNTPWWILVSWLRWSYFFDKEKNQKLRVLLILVTENELENAAPVTKTQKATFFPVIFRRKIENHYYDHPFPRRSRTPTEIKRGISNAASRNLLNCTSGSRHTTEHVEVSRLSLPLNWIIMCVGRSFKHQWVGHHTL